MSLAPALHRAQAWLGSALRATATQPPSACLPGVLLLAGRHTGWATGWPTSIQAGCLPAVSPGPCPTRTSVPHMLLATRPRAAHLKAWQVGRKAQLLKQARQGVVRQSQCQLRLRLR